MLAGVRPRIRYLLIRGQLLVGVYSIGLVKGDYYVNGGAGAQQLLINSGVTGIEIAGGMERVDFAYNSSDLAFKVNGLQIQILNGSNVIATISTNDTAGGTELAFKNGGLKISLDSSDPQNPAFSLTGANGSSQSIPLNSQENVSLDKSFILNSSLTSNVGGGGTPTPTPTKTYAIADLTEAIIAKGGYVIEDIAANLDPAKISYTILNNAKSVVLSDDVEKIVNGGTLTDAAKAALGIAKLEKVEMKGAFDKLMSADASLPEALAAKNPAYVVDETVTSTVNLGEVKVSVVAAAQTQIDTFLAKVTFADTVKEPAAGSVKPGTYTIKDTAEAIVKANADETQKALLTDPKNCKGVIVADSIEAIGELSNNITNLVTSFDVKDTLANIAANAKNVPSKASNTFTATDTGDVDLSLSTKGLENLTTCKPTLDSGLKSISVTADVSEEAANGLDLSADVATVFSGFTGKVNFTGSNKADKFTTTLDADTISTGAGDDQITLDKGAVVTTINLGDAGTGNTLTVTNGSVTTINGGKDKDTIDLSGLTIAEGAKTTVTAGEGEDEITVNALSKGLTIDLTETTAAKDTVTLKAASADLGTSGDANAVTIKGFNATNDKILFDTTDFAKFAADNTGYDISSGGSGTTLVKEKIFFAASGKDAIVAGKEADLRGYLAGTAAEGKLGTFSSANDAAIVVTKADATGKAMNFWYVNGGATASDTTDDIIVLLGTVNSDTVLDFTITNNGIVSA